MSQINHYVPQFILRRYGNKINKYNVKEGRFILKGSIQTAFSKKDIYPDELEEKFSKLESTFARLIDNKILKNNNEIILNRNEIWLIKKFFTVASLRVPASINGPKNLDTKEQYEQMGFKEVEINNETDLEYSYRTLNVILDANCIEDVYNSASVTYEACKWISLFDNCYLSIWDSKECGEDFIITDNGMNCEHDKSRFKIFPNLCGNGPYYNKIDEMIKRGYIYKNLDKAIRINDKNKIYIYHQILERMQYVHANYYLFALSNDRTIALVNPFFRLYYDEIILSNIHEKPNVWPTKISNYALESNKVNYVDDNKFSDNDQFIYQIKNLSLSDVILINCLMLDRVDTWLGFDESSKIIRSLSAYANIPKTVQRNNFDKLIEQLLDNGYALYQSKRYKDISNYMIECSFTYEEYECIEYFYNLILKNKSS